MPGLLNFQRIPRPSLSSGWVWAVWPWLIAALVIFQRLVPVWENDLFLHVRLGEWILSGGGASGNPQWTFGPAEKDWINTLAPAEVLMALAWNLGGYALIAALAAILAGVVTAMVWWGLTALAPAEAKISPGPARAAVLVQFAILMALFDGLRERPQLFSLIFLPVLGVWTVKAATSGTFPKPWWVLILVVPWSWLHGYSLLVAPVLGLAAVAYVLGSGREWKEELRKILPRASLAVGAAFLGTLLTPIGIGIYQSAFRLRTAAGDLIAEWLPTDFAMWQPWIILILLGVWVFGAVRSMSYQSSSDYQGLWREAVLLIGLLVAFLPTARTTLVAAVLVGLLAGYRLMQSTINVVPRPWEPWTPRHKALLCLPVIIVLAWSAIWVVQHPGDKGVNTQQIPVALFNEVAQTPGPHDILIDYNISGAALSFIPDARTAIDGRADRYGPKGAYEYYWGLTRGLHTNWFEILTRYQEANMAILHEESPLRQILIDSGWQVAGKSEGLNDTYLWLIPGENGKSIAEIAGKAEAQKIR